MSDVNNKMKYSCAYPRAVNYRVLSDEIYNKGMGQRDRSAKAGKGAAVKAAGAGQSHFDAATSAGDSLESPIEAFESQDEIAMVRRATEVLGIDHVVHWMRSSIPSLGNHTPYELMKTEDGRNQVERVLLKIEHGVY